MQFMEDRIIKDGRVKEGNILKADTLLEIERLHPDIERWFLDTIQEEAGNCHLYEKIGYKKTGRTEVINEKMTLIFYEKKQAKGLSLPEDL